jgi:hypothetical protein
MQMQMQMQMQMPMPRCAARARREGLDLGDLSPYQRRDRRARGRGGKPTVLQAVTRFATTGLRIPRERAVAHAQRWAASPSPSRTRPWNGSVCWASVVSMQRCACAAAAAAW